MRVDPNAPAFPQPLVDSAHGLVALPEYDFNCCGMTIRAEIASRMMAALITSETEMDDEEAAKAACDAADALINELNKETE